MSDPLPFILGEFQRTLDDRFRVSLPPELIENLLGESHEVILAKERPGCLSVWNTSQWQAKWDAAVQLLKAKLQAGKLEARLPQSQLLGRLLSSRQRTLQLAQRGRLLVPEGFREFLRVEAGGDVMVVGAAVCVEIWNPRAWVRHLDRRMPRFHQLFDELTQ